MIILGINYIFHDTSACILVDGQLVAAVEEERLNREKHTQKFPRNAIESCLQIAGLTHDDIQHVAISVDPHVHVAEKFDYAARLNGSSAKFIDYEFDRLRERHLVFWSWINETYGDGERRPRIHFVDHHLAHVAGSYFVSPFERAALLCSTAGASGRPPGSELLTD